TAPRSSVKPAHAAKSAPAKDDAPTLPFPAGSLSYGTREAVFRQIASTKGHPWSVDDMAAAFRKGCPDFSRPRTDSEWSRIWEKFVVAYAERRANRSDD
ncbi:hypothetical protein OY671_012115, partial [Metschnikowia pulcherrima]